MTTRAAIYCRISKDKVGAGLGVERQQALTRPRNAGIAVHRGDEVGRGSWPAVLAHHVLEQHEPGLLRARWCGPRTCSTS